MSLSLGELEELVMKFQPIIRYTIGEDDQHILFHLENDKEIAIRITENGGGFEAFGQLRDKNVSGFGRSNSFFTGDTELDVVENILNKVLEHDQKRQNR